MFNSPFFANGTEMAKPCTASSMKKWYVIYSKPRWEKKVHRLFGEQGLVSYCPLNRVLRKWSDRYKMVEVPLFSSYVFVQLAETEKLKVRETPGVLNFVYFEGRPAIVKDQEIDHIKRFLSDYENVELSAQDLKVDQKVAVNQGVFIDAAGRVVDIKNGKVQVAIDSLGYNLVAVFDKSQLIALRPES